MRCRISNGSQSNHYQNMEHDTNAKKHIAMFCVTENGRHCKRLIATDTPVEIKGAIQRYFLFQKKKKITDATGMIQNTEIFHQFINIPLPQKPFFLFLFISSYLKNTYKAIFSQSCPTLFRNKKALGILCPKKAQCLIIFILFPAILPVVFPQTAVPLVSVLPFPANPDVSALYG